MHLFPSIFFFYVSLKQIDIFQDNIQMIEPDESLLALLDKSHTEVMTGQTLSMEEVDSFMKNKSLQLKNHVNRKDCMTVDEYIILIKEELDQRYK